MSILILLQGGGAPAFSGSAAISGNGAFVVVGQHAGAASQGVAGGGALAVAPRGAHASAVSVFAAGEIFVAGSREGSATGFVSISGGGAVQAQATGAHTSPAALVGGGTLAASGLHAVADTAALSGGGNPQASVIGAHAAAIARSGGGAITVQGVGEWAGVSGQAQVTGGGSIAVQGATERVVQVVVSGGGAIAVHSTSERLGQVVLSGGGAITVGALNEPPSDGATGGGYVIIKRRRGVRVVEEVDQITVEAEAPNARLIDALSSGPTAELMPGEVEARVPEPAGSADVVPDEITLAEEVITPGTDMGVEDELDVRSVSSVASGQGNAMAVTERLGSVTEETPEHGATASSLPGVQPLTPDEVNALLRADEEGLVLAIVTALVEAGV